MCPPMRARWRHLANTIELVHPSADWSPQPKRQMDRFQPFLHSLWHKVPILYNGRPYPPEVPFSMGDLDLPCNTWCFGPMWAHNRNGTSIDSAMFAQMTAECPYMVCLFCPQNCSFPCWHLDPCNTLFIGPTRVRNANGNLIISAPFAGLTSVTDWQITLKHSTCLYKLTLNYNTNPNPTNPNPNPNSKP